MIYIMTFVIIFLLLSLALFIGLSRAQNPIKASFLALCVPLAVWSLANTFADQSQATALLWTRLAFAMAALAVGGLVMFAIWFPKKSLGSSEAWSLVALAAALVMCVVSFTSFVVPGVEYQNGYANVVTGALYGVYVGYVLLMVGLSITILGIKLWRTSGDEALRVRYVLVGMVFTALFVLTTNLLLPLLSGSNPLAIYGSLGILFLIALMAYTIVKHNLFSIKVATARAVAYVLSGLTLALVFGLIIYGANRVLFGNESGIDFHEIFYILSAVSIGFAFPVIQRFFNTLTKRVLLRDYYDPEVLLTDVSRIIANARTSRTVLNQVTKEIYSSMKLSFVEAYVKDGESWKRKASAGFQAANRVISADEILKAKKNAVIIPLFKAEVGSEQDEEVALLVALRTTRETVGYLLLGYKQNGVGFSKSDFSMLEAIANEAAIATENYLRLEEIEQFNDLLQGRINDATKELRAGNKKLHALDKSKDEFISMASHQLRTPLTAVKGYISMVLEGDVGKISPEQRQVLEQAYDSSQRMVYLIGDFLNVSRLQTGKFELESSSINFTDLVAEEVEQLEDTAGARGITLLYEKPETPHVGLGDENKLRQVMMNFMDNAIFYSPAGTTITVQLYKEAGGLVFKVIDQGIGVPKSEQSKLFSKFFRAENARNQRPDGTGIGLYMAKKVILAHGGTVIFESSEGQGSTFGFKLPKERF